MRKTHIKAAEYRTEDMFPGVSRQILGYDSDIMMVKVYFSKGSIGSLHSHPHQQVSYVLSGKFEVNIGGKIEILESGDTFIAPSDVEHEVKCLKEGVLIDTFSPMRKDFIE